jgi:hypothetical protein
VFAGGKAAREHPIYPYLLGYVFRKGVIVVHNERGEK